ncbi:type III pantothenate kinase [Marinobacter zhejiangensis]|uniref:Type III pantothenate kinase n=1 Tax=Marinobacter zhejiangensis TaxID=488535 RepID=A0A1I4TT01_9GAMM|nr:type III pantothenate kinase [Marinobacter zhejiangensis]SFM79896.1 type III pantothenate kinase [Marinobacter zhejiangensis]
MILLVDMGNTRVKWQVRAGGRVVAAGIDGIAEPALFSGAAPFAAKIVNVAVSTVASEQRRLELVERLSGVVQVPVEFFWSEPDRAGLTNAYADPARMGADRWHAMYGAWRRSDTGFLVVDAGSAITVDFVTTGGVHAGGYILAGKNMMLRGLAKDTARVDYSVAGGRSLSPGQDTTECVFHGVEWFWRAIAERLNREAKDRKLGSVFVTGGDGESLLAHGLNAVHCPDLVLEGLDAIACEVSAS